MTTHRDLYPEQYEHPLCGRTVRIRNQEGTFVVERVVSSRFGLLVLTREMGPTKAFSANDVEVAG